MTDTGPQSSDLVVQLSRASKRFGTVTAVDAISLDIRRGEFFSLLGPSGCGKTTTLRLVAGLEEPDDGDVRLLGKVVNRRRPYERPVAMVFQNYALFPHLDVRRNVAFGLEQRRVPADRIRERVRRALGLVRLDPDTYARRMPSQLSGGQRQRVALARALVIEPAILLLDEPLGAIDLKLRKEMQLELKALNRQLGITFVYVTHDQEEALTMSDRIAVMNQGRVAQVGTPAEIYENPRTAFVADFIGECNFFDGTVAERDGAMATVARDDGLRFRIPAVNGVAPGRAVRIAVRPEWHDVWRPDEVPPAENAIPGMVRDVVYLGETVHVLVRLPEGADARVALRNEGQLTKPVPWRGGDRPARAARDRTQHLQLVRLHRAGHRGRLRARVRGEGHVRHVREQRGAARQAAIRRAGLRRRRAVQLPHAGAAGLAAADAAAPRPAAELREHRADLHRSAVGPGQRAHRPLPLGLHRHRVPARPRARDRGEPGGVVRRPVAWQDDDDGRRPRGPRGDAHLARPLAQLGRAARAAGCPGRRRARQAQPARLQVGAGEGRPHRRRRVGGPALERRCDPGDGGAAGHRIRLPARGLADVGRQPGRAGRRAAPARGARVPELRPPARGRRRHRGRHRLRHREPGRRRPAGAPDPLPERRRDAAPRVPERPGRAHRGVGPHLDGDQVGVNYGARCSGGDLGAAREDATLLRFDEGPVFPESDAYRSAQRAPLAPDP